jgi:hypothetical protein
MPCHAMLCWALLTVEACGLVPSQNALADRHLARPAGLLGRAAGRAHRQGDALPVRPGLLRRASLCRRRRSLNSSSSGSPSVLSSSSSPDVPSPSTPLSWSSPRLRFDATGANFSGFFVTRPDLRRALEVVVVASPASESAATELMVIARDVCVGWAGNRCNKMDWRVELAERS